MIERKRLMFKKIISILSTSILLCIIVTTESILPVNADSYINNAELMPKYVDDSKVTLENGGPDWIKTLIMAELHVETATDEGTLDAAVKVMDHYQEMGVNGFWITPINDKGTTGNGYGNLGPETISPKLTGTTDYTKGWQVVKKFIDEAHKRNIRVFMDIISWGTTKESPIYKQHPDWYTGKEVWGGYEWNWANENLKQWYINTIENIALTTGVDGFRCDLEPSYAGYTVQATIRSQLLAKGRKIAIFSENGNERGESYDFEQTGVFDYNKDLGSQYANPIRFFMDKFDIVDSIKSGNWIGSQFSQDMGQSGTYRFYTNCISNHDYKKTVVNGNRITIGYQAIFAPFIPLWYIGEEWNNPKVSSAAVLYDNKIDWSQLNVASNRKFYEDVKQMIRIRRQYPDIFNYYPENHQESNICTVKVNGLEELQAYARYSNGNGILIVPNYNIHDQVSPFTIHIPFNGMDMSNYKSYTVKDLLTGKTIVSGSKEKVNAFKVKVDLETVGVFLVTGSGVVSTSSINTNEVVISSSEDLTSSTDNGSSENASSISDISIPSSKIQQTSSGTTTTTSGFPTIAIVLIIVGVLFAIGVAIVVPLIKAGKIPWFK